MFISYFIIVSIVKTPMGFVDKRRVSKVKHQVCYINIIIKIINEREEIQLEQEIRVSYYCVIKLN